MPNTMKCTRCKRDVFGVTTFICVSSRETQYICDECLVKDCGDCKDLETLDRQMEEAQTICDNLERIAKTIPFDDGGIDDNLRPFCMTPERAYHGARMILTNMRKSRDEILAACPSQTDWHTNSNGPSDLNSMKKRRGFGMKSPGSRNRAYEASSIQRVFITTDTIF